MAAILILLGLTVWMAAIQETLLIRAICVHSIYAEEEMKKYILASWIFAVLFVQCSKERRALWGQNTGDNQGRTAQEITMIDKEKAVSIAKEDAIKAYGLLDDYNIILCEQTHVWRVIFELKDPGLNGGGPEYVIDKKTGRILHKRYYQ